MVADIRSGGATSVGAIAAELNARGMLTRRGGGWHKSMVMNLLDRLGQRQAPCGQSQLMSLVEALANVAVSYAVAVAMNPARETWPELESDYLPRRSRRRPPVGYLPDIAETIVRPVEAGQAEPFTNYHMAGHWDPDGTAMIEAIRAALGHPDLPVRRFPWPAVRLAQPRVPFFRELAEMRYLWRTPVRMSNARLVEAIGPEPHTPLRKAVRESLAGLGCLPADARRRDAA